MQNEIIYQEDDLIVYHQIGYKNGIDTVFQQDEFVVGQIQGKLTRDQIIDILELIDLFTMKFN